MKTNLIPHQPINGLIARCAIQCTCPDTGLSGTFLYSGESWRNAGSRVTPVYDDLYEMLQDINRADSPWDEVKDGGTSLGFIYNMPMSSSDARHLAHCRH